ncbi:xylulokinase [Castellaniella hirudinis]|uniref:xylulokinase n=1 Tax=Castellaniella hirudinis TaxID=1144617 RepID=UPI0039C2C95A
MPPCVLGIDIGTSACKALLLAENGQLLGSETIAYGLMQPRPGWVEQDPASWINGAQIAVQRLLAAQRPVRVAAVGLTGQMHGLTPLDASGRVLRPALLWNDQRNAEECAWAVDAAGGPQALHAYTGNGMLPGYTGGKLLWMRRHEPALFRRLRHALNPKDYLRLVLTGEIATEVSDASGTGLFDVRRRVWSQPLMDRLDLDPALFAPCHESPEITGRVSARGAALFGLPAGIPVVGGGGDSIIQTLGSGVLAPGAVQTIIGTGGIVASTLDEPLDDPAHRLQVFCHVLPEKWHAMGVTLNAGFAMSWAQRLLRGFSDEAHWSYDDMAAIAAHSPAGSRGLIFLPYLNGERAPYADPALRGGFIGLISLHQPADIVRAVMEGIVYALYDIYTLMAAAGIQADTLRASGGGARSALWRQMQASLFDCQVVTTQGAAEGAAFGAALVAGLGVGLYADPAEIARICRPLTIEVVDPAMREGMQAGFSVYRALHAALAEHLHGLSRTFGGPPP